MIGAADLSQAQLRSILGQFVTGICAVSTRFEGPDGACHDAVMVNSFTSVSLDPPLVLMCLRSDSMFLERLQATRQWTISFLGNQARPLITSLTTPAAARPPVNQAAEWVVGPRTGCLMLAEGPGALECGLHLTTPLGDHVLVVGQILGAVYRDEEPLVFHRGTYTEVVPV